MMIPARKRVPAAKHYHPPLDDVVGHDILALQPRCLVPGPSSHAPHYSPQRILIGISIFVEPVRHFIPLCRIFRLKFLALVKEVFRVRK